MQYHYFAYGVGDYGGSGSPNLPYAYEDGIDVRALFDSQGMDKLSQHDGATVTKADILSDISAAATKIDSNDIVIFYFAGHGAAFHDGSGSYLQPSDGSIGSDELWQALDGLGAFHTIVILDACYSGGFMPDGYGSDSLPDSKESLIDLNGDTNNGFMDSFSDYFKQSYTTDASLISASGKNEESYEADGNGIFTRYFLEAATGADYNNDGFMTLSEVYRYTFRKIQNQWNLNFMFSNPFYAFLPHISEGGIDPVLFTANK